MSLPRVCLSLADHRKTEDASSSSSPPNNILKRLPPPGGPIREVAAYERVFVYGGTDLWVAG